MTFSKDYVSKSAGNRKIVMVNDDKEIFFVGYLGSMIIDNQARDKDTKETTLKDVNKTIEQVKNRGYKDLSDVKNAQQLIKAFRD